MADPTLTVDRLREVLEYDPTAGVFRWRIQAGRVPPGGIAGTSLSRRYWIIRVDGCSCLAHRLAWFYVHGRWPADQIDHINGDGFDNRISNLREATAAENQQNQSLHRNNTSGYPGVHRSNGRWKAQIKVGGRKIHLGQYDTAEEAHGAYLAAKVDRHPFQPFTRAA